MNWTDEDQMNAHRQGWGVFRNSEYGLQIEKLDDPSSVGLLDEPRFIDDDAAVSYVAIRASEGCILARKAIEYIRNEKENYDEG